MGERHERALVVMARAPKPGRVKTRLCPPLTGEEAAGFYECLLQDSLRRLSSTPQWDAWVGYTHGSRGYFRPNEGRGFSLLRQRGDSLGVRMHALFLELFDLGYRSVILVGSDIPGITRKAVERAFWSLETQRCDVVIGPTHDGGYYLIGLRRPVVALFQNIAWSSVDVLEQTLTKAADLGLRVATVRSAYDVDVVSDLERLWVDLEGSGRLRQSLPRTYQWLRSYHLT